MPVCITVSLKRADPGEKEGVRMLSDIRIPFDFKGKVRKMGLHWI